MDYELCKELKKAGFPKDNFYITEPNSKYPNQKGQRGAPTLSELIEACGKGLQSLINDFENEEGGWIAFTNRKDDKGERMEIWGETPEIAVAKLWLAINKKDGK